MLLCFCHHDIQHGCLTRKRRRRLQAMLATLQKQNRGLQAEVKRHRAAAAADEALKAEASQARAALAVCFLDRQHAINAGTT